MTLNRTIAPSIKDAVAYPLSLKPYTFFRLSNGVEVYSVDAGPQDVVQLEFVFDAGNAYEDQNLVSASANYLLKNGTNSRSAFAINEHFEYFGAYLNRSSYTETSMITLHSMSKHLPELLPVLRELITESVFPQEELDIYRQNMKQRLAVNLKKAEFVAGRLIGVSLFGSTHPYGRYSAAEDFDALSREKLLAFFEQYYKKGRLRIFAAGRIPSDLEAQLEKSFGDLPLSKQGIVLPTHAISSASEKKARVLNDPDGLQGSIRLGRLFPNKHHPDHPKVQVLNTVFGGYFGSRLMRNIREEKGYTYGIHSYLQPYIQESTWMISTEAGKEVCEAAVAEIYLEMERLRNEPIGAEELNLVRNYMIGTMLGDLDGPFHIIGRWKNLILQGLDEEYFHRYISLIKNIPASELQELAVKYLQPGHFYELVVV
jgi:zinc protease